MQLRRWELHTIGYNNEYGTNKTVIVMQASLVASSTFHYIITKKHSHIIITRTFHSMHSTLVQKHKYGTDKNYLIAIQLTQLILT